MAALPVNNPQHILKTLDSFLEKETRIVLFGRAALALGFGDEGLRFGATQDVDAILPSIEMSRIKADSQFWDAIDKTNKQLEPSGLYVSHLFTDRQVALTADWLEKVVKIPSEHYKFLRLYRPSTADLVLTKMMRNDKEDLKDIAFILEQGAINGTPLKEAFNRAQMLEVPDLQAIFVKMQPIVLSLSRAIELNRSKGASPNSAFYSMDPDWWEKLTNEPSQQRTPEKERDISL